MQVGRGELRHSCTALPAARRMLWGAMRLQECCPLPHTAPAAAELFYKAVTEKFSGRMQSIHTCHVSMNPVMVGDGSDCVSVTADLPFAVTQMRDQLYSH